MLRDNSALLVGAMHPPEEDPHEAMLRIAARNLIDAVHAKDSDAVKDAFRAAFAACEAMPHEENEEGEEE